MNLFLIIAAVFMVWMCLDCIQRKEHFVWIIIMVVLFPIGALAYFFAVKSRVPATDAKTPQSSTPVRLFKPSAPKVVENEETLQLKEMIKKFHKPFHYEKLGLAYLEQRKFDLAIEPFREAIKRDAESLESRYGLAKCHHALGQPKEAAEVLEELVKIDKKYDYGNAIFGLAESYRLSGQEDKAINAYKTVIDTYHFFKAYYHYAILLEKRGQKEEAIEHMKSIIASSKDLPEYKLEKERHWIEEAYKFLRKNGIEIA